MIEPDKNKKCSRCKIIKPITEYHKVNKVRWRSDCRICRKIKNAECYQKRKARYTKNELCKMDAVALVPSVS